MCSIVYVCTLKVPDTGVPRSRVMGCACFLGSVPEALHASLKTELGLENCEHGGVVSWLVGCWSRLIIICALVLEEGVE